MGPSIPIAFEPIIVRRRSDFTAMGDGKAVRVQIVPHEFAVHHVCIVRWCLAAGARESYESVAFARPQHSRVLVAGGQAKLT